MSAKAGTDGHAERGFTLLELMIVLAIVAIILAIAIPTFLIVKRNAQDRAAQTAVSTALKAERAYYLSFAFQRYTGDGAELEDIEPSIDYDAVLNDSCVAFSAPNCVEVTLVSLDEVVVMARAKSGTYWAVRDVASGAGAGTFYNVGGDAAPPAPATIVGDEW